jgi:hypothetical protein
MVKKQSLSSYEWTLLRMLEEERHCIKKEEGNWPTKTWLKKRISELKKRAGEEPST